VSTPPTDWRYRLRGDPARWLLDDADNPSVYFWFQRDIVGRPEDAAALIRAREMILYSPSVQTLLAAQAEGGYWDNPSSLAEPRYRATLWSLAVLAELGVPRTSRRARAACEFVLQNHLTTDGTFAGLDDQASMGLLLRTMLYFNYQDDPRVVRAIDAFAANAPTTAPGAAVYAVWALTEIPPPRRSPRVMETIAQGAESILDALARGAFPVLGAFPPFDASDALLALRVLTDLGRSNDPRAAGVIERIWARQSDGARWSLEKHFDGITPLDLETASKWATLNVLRIVTKL